MFISLEEQINKLWLRPSFVAMVLPDKTIAKRPH
jgi:hypothetical protein